MSSSNNEILNRVLELCEEHMTEGEYLRSSKLLKTVSEKNPDISNLIKTVRFVQPIKIKIGDTLTVFVVGYIAHRHSIHCGFTLKKVLFKIHNNEIQINSGSTSSFSDILKTIIKSEMAYNIEIYDFFGIVGNTKHFNREKFIEFFSDINDDVYGIELYHEFVNYISTFISEYVSNIIKEWKNEPIIS
jgi:hypothetical protein